MFSANLICLVTLTEVVQQHVKLHDTFVKILDHTNPWRVL